MAITVAQRHVRKHNVRSRQLLTQAFQAYLNLYLLSFIFLYFPGGSNLEAVHTGDAQLPLSDNDALSDSRTIEFGTCVCFLGFYRCCTCPLPCAFTTQLGARAGGCTCHMATVSSPSLFSDGRGHPKPVNALRSQNNEPPLRVLAAIGVGPRCHSGPHSVEPWTCQRSCLARSTKASLGHFHAWRLDTRSALVFFY